MFKANESMADRAIRVIVGIVLLALYFMNMVTGGWAWAALIVGIIALVTGVVGWCALYTVLGISTKPAGKA